jgi:hypothetical protein
LTLPAATDTLVGKATTDTLTNKTLTGAAMNGTVGATTPSTGAFTTLSATGVTTVQAGTAAAPAITTTGDTNTGLFFPAADTIAFAEGGAESMRITSAGELILGGTSALLGQSGSLVIEGNNASPFLSLFRNDTSVSSGNGLGVIRFYGNDTTSNTATVLATITAEATAAHAAGDNPTALVFGTTAAGSATVTERARIDSSGNLGLGVTPSAWGTFKAIEIASAGSSVSSAGSTDIRLTGNAYYNGTNWKYAATNLASMYSQNSGIHEWYIAASGSAGANLSWTTAMTLNASGNLGVGATSIPAGFRLYASGGSMLLDNNTAFRQKDSAGNNTLMFTLSSGNNFELGSGNHTGGMAIVTGNSNITFTTNSAERARIDSSGNLLVGKTSSSVLSAGSELTPSYVSCAANTVLGYFHRTSSNGDVIQFYRNSSQVGAISVTTTATTYTTSSDYRLKNTIAPMTGALAKVALLKPVTYKWNVDGSNGQGFIAHELQEVVEGCVTGEKDELDADGNPKYQGIDTSFLVATLTAAIQELKALVDTQASTITTLTDRITALEQA